MPIINGIYTKDFPALGRDLLETDIIVIAITGDAVTYRSTVSAIRDAFCVSNATTSELTATQLDAAYPSAALGLDVICEDITDNPLIYKKGASGWYSIPLGTIAP